MNNRTDKENRLFYNLALIDVFKHSFCIISFEFQIILNDWENDKYQGEQSYKGI